MCVKAWGKFPRSRCVAGSYSSDRSPTSLRTASRRSNSSRASATRPWSARLAANPRVDREFVGQPERAREEGAFAGRQAVDVRLGLVARHEAVGDQMLPDGPHGTEHPRIAGREKADEGNHEETRVEELGSVGLDEGPQLGVVAVPADVCMNHVAELTPPV